MNKIIKPKTGPKGIVYVNDVPYGYALHVRYNLLSGLRRVGSKGEDIRSVGLWTIWKGGNNFIEGFKVVGTTCYCTCNERMDSPSIFDSPVSVIDGVIGGISRSLRALLVYPDGRVSSFKPKPEGFQLKDTYKIANIDGVKNIYNISTIEAAILQDNKDRLFVWRGEPDVKDCIKIPGTEVKQLTYSCDKTDDILSDFILTDKGLFLYNNSAEKFLKSSSPLKYNIISNPEAINMLSFIPLPEGVTPHNIEDISAINLINLFLLTNDGKVYAMGKNNHYQRGTTKKLKPDEWNEIKYPEKIKQISTIFKDRSGLFALSENGNLYYHGYNENSYYPLTNRRSNIAKPMKVMEGVQSVWVPNDSSLSFVRKGLLRYTGINPLFITTDSNDLIIFPTKPMVGKDSLPTGFVADKDDKVYPVRVYDKLSSSLLFTPNMIKAKIISSC